MQAGATIRDITPQHPVVLVGFPHIERISEGMHDPLLASALYLRTEGTALVLIALDILYIDPPTARELRHRVAVRVGVPQDCVFISCTHTHSGPNTMYALAWEATPMSRPVDADYMRFIAETIADAAAEAAHQVCDVEIAWCSVMAHGVGGNRHDPEHGAVDPEVGLLVVRARADRRLLALSMIYSMHPTVLHEDSRLISADFPHFTREFLKEHLGGELTVLYHTGPEGNQSPRHAVTANTFAEAQRIGERLGAEVYERIHALLDEDFVADIALDARMTQVALPHRTLPTLEEAEQRLTQYRATYEDLKRSGAAHGAVRTAECDIFGAEETASLAACRHNGRFDEIIAKYTPVDVQAMRIGETFLLGFPGELFVEYSLAAKRRAGWPVFPVTLVNGDLRGYIVTPEAVDKGYYEATNRVFDPEAGNVLVDTALGLLADLVDS